MGYWLPILEYVQRFATKEAADAATEGNDLEEEDEEMSDIGSISEDGEIASSMEPWYVAQLLKLRIRPLRFIAILHLYPIHYPLRSTPPLLITALVFFYFVFISSAVKLSPHSREDTHGLRLHPLPTSPDA